MDGTPFIPEQITVHLGTPDSNAPNVTVSFPDYIKNVISSEIYPTWPENSIRANIYAAVSFALNRIYTEWYRSKGYDFDITNSTQFDQAFVNGREIFQPVSVLVDELFNSYLRRRGNVEPLFAAFCNGTTVTCEGLSQWGTVELAKQGFTPYEILTYYYGDNLEIVQDAPIAPNVPSYPERPLQEGDSSNDVRAIQIRLRRIAQNYPAIPVIPDTDGVFSAPTAAAVEEFQRIFSLPATGVVDQATWYRIEYIYNSVKKLAELSSEGEQFENVQKQYTEDLRPGMESMQVKLVQYYLAVVGAYYEQVQPVEITGYYGDQTAASVRSFQQVFGLPQTGIINRATWNQLTDAYLGIVADLPATGENVVAIYPGTVLKEGTTSESVRIAQEYLNFLHGVYPQIPAVNNTGYFGPVTRSAVLAFQRLMGLEENGLIGPITWDELTRVYSEHRFGYDKRPYQHPGYTIK